MRKKTTFAQVLEKENERKFKKIASKLPSWSEVPGIQLPDILPIEQCSSSLTADFKANLLARALPSTLSVADLTGGFGADSWSLAKQFSSLYYFEQNSALFETTRHNLMLLKEKFGLACEMHFSNERVTGESIKALGKVDCIYIDPARRSLSGSKVFLLEDCTPNVLELLPTISEVSPFLLIKCSPMADITMLRERLSSAMPDYPVRGIGVIGIKDEVKEVLVLCGRGSLDIPELFVADAALPEITALPPSKPVSKVADSISGQYLLEPNALILKSGCQDVCCELWAARKCAPSCHVYLCDEKPEGEMARYYKTFEVIEIKDYSKSSLKEVAAAYPVCEVSAKALPVRSEELARRLKVKSGIAEDGSHYHIFALGTVKGKKLIVGRHL